MPRFARRTDQRPIRGPVLLGWMLAVVATLSGCGYTSTIAGASARSDATAFPGATAVPGATALDGEGGQAKVVRLAVLGLRNDSPEPWLDRILGDALRREMNLRSTLRLVSNPDDADLVLRGRIRPLNIRSNSFSSFVAALEYEVTLELDLEVVRSSGDVVRLDARGLSESELYLASPDIETSRTNRLEALRHLSDVLASRIADRVEAIQRPLSTSGTTSGMSPGASARDRLLRKWGAESRRAENRGEGDTGRLQGAAGG